MPRVHLPDGRIVNFPDDMAPAQIEAEVTKLVAPQGAPPPAQAGPQSTLANKAIDALPTIGGAVGGFVGRLPVLGTALAGAGGVVGEGYRQAIEAGRGLMGGTPRNLPSSFGGQLAAMGKAGATQAGLEGGGRIVSAGVGAVAPGLYRGALRAAQGLKDKYPGMVKEGLANRVIVGGQRGVEKARGLMKASKGEADTAVAAAGGAAPVTRRELRKGLVPLVSDAKNAAKAGLPDERRAIAARAQALPAQMPVGEAHQVGRTLNTRADRAFRAEQRGGQPASLNDRMNKAIAESMGDALKTRIPGDAATKTKGLADINARTSNLYGLTKALKRASERPSVLGNLMAGGAGVLTLGGGGDFGDATGAYLAMRGLSSPRTLSGLGIAANEVGQHPAAIANAMRAALLASLRDEEPEKDGQ